MKTKDICRIALCALVLFVQEQILSLAPNIQLTVMLMILYTKKLGRNTAAVIIALYLFLDVMYSGSLGIIYLPFMLAGWLIIPFATDFFFKNNENELTLALAGAGFSLAYCWMYIIPSVLVMKMDFISYMIADLPFELLMAASSFLSVWWLYRPLSAVMEKLAGK